MNTSACLEWPSARWSLTAPESHALLHDRGASGRDAFKLGLMELIARGALSLDPTAERRALVGVWPVAVLRAGPTARAPREQPLAAIWELFEATRPSDFLNGPPGVQVRDLANTAARRLGSIDGYLGRVVVPALVARGLVELRRERWLRILPVTRRRLSGRGEVARAELERWLQFGRSRLGAWSGGDPARALAFASAAGAAVLLMPELFPELRRLRQQLPADFEAGEEAGATTRTAFESGERGQPVSRCESLDSTGLDFESAEFGSTAFERADCGTVHFGSADFGSIDFEAVDFAGLDFGSLD
ncbi:MAG: hypothetical protein M3336_03670, partial [Chloroflexota bacterium]|nr:hypothetical protein [Chloroflexota bacterium]